MMVKRHIAFVAVAILAASLWAPEKSSAQRRWQWWNASHDPERLPRLVPPTDTFTFCRIRYTSWNNQQKWAVDYPDSDLNFSERLEELTTINVSRTKSGEIRHVVLNLTDEEIFNYPFIYMLEVGELEFTEEEIEQLRKYLFRGGFLMVDDFWGPQEWHNWEYEIGRVFPADEYKMVELGLDHPIFNCVFVLHEKPQVPSLYFWANTGLTSERYQKSKDPHYKGIFDKDGRLMVVICHNTDLGDGWEREGENEQYFQEFSAKKAYPLGINIVVYAMTH